MREALLITVLVCVACDLLTGVRTMDDDEDDTEYTNTWVAEIHGGEHVAQRIAKELGYNYQGPAGYYFRDHYVMTRDDHPEVSKRSSLHLTQNLMDRDEVKWAEQQFLLKRSLRGYVPQMEEKSEPQPRGYDEATLLARLEEAEKLLLALEGAKPQSSLTSNSPGSKHTVITSPDGSSSMMYYSSSGNIDPEKLSKIQQQFGVNNGQQQQTSGGNKYGGPYKFGSAGKLGSGDKVGSSDPFGSDDTFDDFFSSGDKFSSGQKVGSGQKLGSGQKIGSNNPVVSGQPAAQPLASGQSQTISIPAGADPETIQKLLLAQITAQGLDPSEVQVSVNGQPVNLGSLAGGAATGGAAAEPQKVSQQAAVAAGTVVDDPNKSASSAINDDHLKPPSSWYLPDGGQGDTSQLGKFSTDQASPSTLSKYEGVTKHVENLSRKVSAYKGRFNDPLWPKQWYSQDYRTQDGPVMDFNVVPVYKMGITGKGIVVGVVDDGVKHGHPDLQANFLQDKSYDMCLDKPGSDPPAATPGQEHSHGTKCAGEIAMIADNGVCGVGIAYNSKIIGIRTLGGRTTQYTESKGLNHELETVDIYSNSWGPSDDGITMDRPSKLTFGAFQTGLEEGRGGKGAIYLFAGGNGRHDQDNCGADVLVNHYATIGIASVTQRGKIAYYSERCTAIFAGAYSGGGPYDEAVASINVDYACTTTFSGTSAATPMATGIVALTLEANKRLTYRDVMHLIAWTSEVAPLADNRDIWYKNGRGFWVSNDFGFGLLNAKNMVTAAKTWTNVPEKHLCVVSAKPDKDIHFTVGKIARLEFETDACQNQEKKDDAVYYLEQVEVTASVSYPYRGAISIEITSPAKTKSDLFETRPKDNKRSGLVEWSIKTVHNWGENPKGKWRIDVKANPMPGISDASGYVQDFTLRFHGTSEKPAHYNKPRKYAAFRLNNGKTSED